MTHKATKNVYEFRMLEYIVDPNKEWRNILRNDNMLHGRHCFTETEKKVEETNSQKSVRLECFPYSLKKLHLNF